MLSTAIDFFSTSYQGNKSPQNLKEMVDSSYEIAFGSSFIFILFLYFCDCDRSQALKQKTAYVQKPLGVSCSHQTKVYPDLPETYPELCCKAPDDVKGQLWQKIALVLARSAWGCVGLFQSASVPEAEACGQCVGF